MSDVFNIYFDGSSIPYSGSCKLGVVIENMETKEQQYFSKHIGNGTSNYAEFMALWYAISLASIRGYKKVNFFGDNQLVIDTMNGNCTLRKPVLLAIYLGIEELSEEFDWVSYIKIKRNTGLHDMADKLSKQ